MNNYFHKIKQFCFLLNFISITIQQVQWNVSSAPYTTEYSEFGSGTDLEFANWLKNNIEQAIATRPENSQSFCDSLNPDFPLDSGTVCGVKAGRDICWKFVLTFKDTSPCNLKLQLGGDFGRGMALFVNGVLDDFKKENVWWNNSWSNRGVLKTNYNFAAGTNQVIIYGGEDCCEGQQNLRFSRNGGPWMNFDQDNILEEFPFDCTFPCKTCSMDPRDCYTCEPSNRDIDKNCICEDTYYNDINNNCQVCPKKCKTCLDENTCITCTDLQPVRQEENQCACPEYNYYEDSNQECQQCQSSCALCPNQTSCIKCKGSESQESSRIKNQDCKCPVSYYDNLPLHEECQKCDPKCLQCNTLQICTKCVDFQENQILRVLNNQCECPDNYFSTFPTNNVCQKCPDICFNCDQTLICTQCIDKNTTNPLRDINNNCKCPNNYVSRLPDQIECIPCPAICDNSCIQGECLSCIGQQNEESSRIPESKCQCPNGYHDGYPLIDGCYQCSQYCNQCDPVSLICQQCQGQQNQEFSRIINQNCECPEGYYHDDVFQDCQKCPIECSACDNQNLCTKCKGSELLEQSRLVQFNCTCPLNYFDDLINNMIECQKCNEECLECDSAINCTKCIDFDLELPLRQQSNNCLCPDSFYQQLDITNQCLKCPSQCKTCDNLQNCIKCIDSEDSNPLRLISNDCKCPDNYLNLLPDIYQCQDCPQYCNSCVQGECIQCVGIQNQSESRLIEQNCNCPQGYKDALSITPNCYQCEENCIECDPITLKCTKCIGSQEQISSRIKENGCKCPDFYYHSENSLECQRCYDMCKVCQNNQSCEICNQGPNTQIKREPSNNCICPEKYFSDDTTKNCIRCPQNCQLCKNSNTCDKCEGLQNQPESRNLKNNCNCPQFYLEISNQCLKCNEQCESCINKQNNCTKCKVKENAKPFPSCDCKENYQFVEYTNTKGELQYKCELIQILDKNTYFCKTYNSKTKQCTSCKQEQNRVLIEGKCQCDIFYEENVQKDENNKNIQQPYCIQQEHMFSEVILGSSNIMSQTVFSIVLITLVTNPVIFIHSLDTLQMIIYTQYVNIEYPSLLIQYWDFFSGFKFQFFPKVLEQNQKYQQPPPGFQKYDYNSYLFDNLNVPIFQLLIIIIILIIVNIIYKIKQFQGFSKFKKQKIEINIILTYILSMFFTILIPTFLQLRSLQITDTLDLFAYIVAQINTITLIIIPFAIFKISILAYPDKYQEDIKYQKWYVQSGFYNTEVSQIDNIDDNIYVQNLVNLINNSLSQTRLETNGFCDRQNPSFPLNSLSMCGYYAKRDICWKFIFKFWENSDNINYKIDFAGDFGRGVAIFVDGMLENYSKDNLFWYYDWNNNSVQHLDLNLNRGYHEIIFYGGEDCCDYPQHIRLKRNNSDWNLMEMKSLLNLFPFNCTFPCEKCNIDQTVCYQCVDSLRDLNNGCNCKDGYFQNNQNICTGNCFLQN